MNEVQRRRLSVAPASDRDRPGANRYQARPMRTGSYGLIVADAFPQG